MQRERERWIDLNLSKGPSINDVEHLRGEGVVQNITLVLTGFVNGAVTSDKREGLIKCEKFA